MASEGTSRSLQDTPTWALATVCFIFIFLSIFMEHLIHLLSQFLKRHRKTALFEAVEKVKSVLMLLGFMSLILTVTQRWISKICIPTKAAYTMLPCRKQVSTKTTKAIEAAFEAIHRRLAETEDATTSTSTSSSTTTSEDQCEAQGKTSFISQGGLNQLNNFIFVLAIMQIVYSVLTMALGRAKMKRWEAWERETQTVEYQVANDPNRFRFTRQTTFARRHMNSCTGTPIQLWIKCFFRQFFHSVERVDYLTLRHGFVSTHLSTNNVFNFQEYIERSLDDDFKEVVGISPFMWLMVVIFILVDVHGWQVYLWVSFVPLIIVLVLGTKLEVVVARMAHQLGDQHNVIKGTPLVQPKDSHFWFSKPRFVLTLVHLTLFMNAFELAFFIWVTLQYGIHSCYHERIELMIVRVVLAVVVQVVCSYITLPLYALVTQMGSNFKSTQVLEEQTTNVMKQWHADVKKKRKKNKHDNSESGYDYSSTIGRSSRRTMNSSLDFSSHMRQQPTFAEMSRREIAEDGQEIVEENQAAKGTGRNEIELASQSEIELASTSASSEVRIEITKGEPNGS